MFWILIKHFFVDGMKHFTNMYVQRTVIEAVMIDIKIFNLWLWHVKPAKTLSDLFSEFSFIRSDIAVNSDNFRVEIHSNICRIEKIQAPIKFAVFFALVIE